MRISNLDDFLWAAGFVCNFSLCCVLLIRHRVTSFPCFSAFVGFCAIRTIVLFSLWHFSLNRLYLSTYWCLVVVDTGLQFAVIWEVASNVFRRHGSWARDIRRRLIAYCAASAIVALCLVSLQVPSGRSIFQHLVLHADFFCSVLISELFVAMLVLSVDAGLNWKSHVARIALGLAAFNFPAVVIETINDLHGFDRRGYLDAALQTARKELYIACVVYWCFSLWQPEPEPRIMSPRMQGQVAALGEAVVKRNAKFNEL